MTNESTKNIGPAEALDVRHPYRSNARTYRDQRVTGPAGLLSADTLGTMSAMTPEEAARLPRGVSTGVLTSTLSKVAQVLQTQAADILEGTPAGLARLDT
jgi:hypothetical protein